MRHEIDDNPPRPPEEAHRPVEQRADPVLEARQEGEVHGQPEQPADEAGDAHRAELADRVVPRYRGKAAEVPVAEGLRRGVTAKPPADLGRGVPAGLDGDLRLAGEPVQRHQVADHEYLGVPGQRAVRLHRHLAGPCRLDAGLGRERGSERRGLHAGRPHLRHRVDPLRSRLGAELQPGAAHVRHESAGADLDAHALELRGGTL